MPTFTFASALVAFQSLSIQSEAEKLQICFAFFLASFTLNYWRQNMYLKVCYPIVSVKGL